MNDLISRQAAIDAFEEDMVSGANSAEDQAWYKADDVYKTIADLPSAQPVAKDINVPVNDTISRQEAINLFGQQSNLSPDERQININSLRKISTSVGLNIFDMHKIIKNDPIAWSEKPEPYREEGDVYKTIEGVPSTQPKKKLSFSERQKIVYEYHDWCLTNNAYDCAETFLAYLCIKGFI